MKKTILIIAMIFAALPFRVSANEGMWFLMFIERLNYRDMQKMGLQLTPEEIYSINNNSLKDAIVQFDGGCTAEIISDKGLVLTNHHCGYEAIAELATPQDDILTNGFWAKNMSEERKPKELSVRFFVRMDDVTKRILGVVNNKMSEREREQAINREIAKIEKENNEGGKYTVSVRSFFQGNEYYYFVYQDYQDVRLVGTPPNAIGKYGGDTDNWEWPRHTGDFALFRVYADANNQPADYAPTNQPLKPKHFLPINIKGVEKGDFTMILGYPGRTNRWMPAEGIQQNVDYAYPAWVEGSKLGMDVMKKYMDQNDEVRINYASKYAQVANYWKNRQGMIEALKAHKTADKKRKDEKKFDKWANKTAQKKVYGNVIKNINAYYKATNTKARHDNYIMTTLRTSNLATLPFSMGRALVQYANANEAERANMKSYLEEAINDSYNGFYAPLEKEMLARQLHLYATKSTGYEIAPYIKTLATKNNNDFSGVINQAFDQSVFASKENLTAYLNSPNAEQITNDELYKISESLLIKYREMPQNLVSLKENYDKSFRLLVDGYRKANPKKKYYPDANSTLRLTYGKVVGLPLGNKVNDAKQNWYTTLKGTIAKHKAGDEEFENPQKLIDLYNAKDYGVYANMHGELPVNFLTDHDITGGNSGSPVINAKGELVGLAFDGNIEAMAGDVIFDKKLQRTINVDARYILFIIDKYAGATNILDELKIVK